MRIGLLLAWIAVPIAFAFYHFGPGQEAMQDDQAAVEVKLASYHVAAGEWQAADEAYTSALSSLSATAEDRQASQQLRLERAKARMMSQQLPAAYEDLTALLEELESQDQVDAKLLSDARASMASAEYYLTWLMRLEGEPRENWELEIESARQTFRLLAEEAKAAGNEQASQRFQEDVESAIRLARMSLTDLEALDLPGQCKKCSSGQCNCKCKKPGKKPGGNKKSKDARGASSGPPADGSGS